MRRTKLPSPAEQVQWLRDRMNYDSDRCLRWPFSYDKDVGRGKLLYEGESWWAHRLMCLFVNGPPPEDKPQSAHSCGNGHMGCVHPRHLSWSDQSGNHLERRKHGTATTNRHGYLGKLTDEQIDQIRALKGKQTQMATARQFNISHANVRYWQGSTHYPKKPSWDPRNIKRRKNYVTPETNSAANVCG